MNHFQLTSIGARDPNYFRVGDWHDTLFEPSRSAGLRFYTDRFAGPMVVHCHNYVHSDQGMMKVIEIEGADGAAIRAADDACPTPCAARFPGLPENVSADTSVFPNPLPNVNFHDYAIEDRLKVP